MTYIGKVDSETHLLLLKVSQGSVVVGSIRWHRGHHPSPCREGQGVSRSSSSQQVMCVCMCVCVPLLSLIVNIGRV